MSIYQSEYLKGIKGFSKKLDKKYLNGKTIALSGATGLIGSFLIDSCLIDAKFNGHFIAMVRSIEKAKERFGQFDQDPRLEFVNVDLTKPIEIKKNIDIVIHAASLTSPSSYAINPVETMVVNFTGSINMLDLAVAHKAQYMFISSTEVYGQLDVESIKEKDMGFIDPMEVRSCYNEAKKASETLTIAYAKEKGLKVIIPRISRAFGPTMKIEDSKALSQFIKNGIKGEPIVLKSKGNQIFSYIYVSDVVSGLIFLLEFGKPSEAYNLANEEIISLAQLASIVAELSSTKVIFDIKEESNMSYSKTMKAIQNIDKIKDLGWSPKISLKTGLKNTILILKQ